MGEPAPRSNGAARRLLEIVPKVDSRLLVARLEAETLRRDLKKFQKAAWKFKHPTRKLDWGIHHDAICEHLQACRTGQIQRLVINVHPRSLKSETVSVDFPAWWWTDDPTKQFVVASSDKDVVFRDADAMRDLCASPWYQDTFRPDWSFKIGESSRKQDAKGYYRNTAGGHRISKTMGQKGQGVNADVLIIDDPLDASDAFTDKAELTKHVVYFKQKLLMRMNDDRTGVVIVIMQRLHELDLSGVLLEEGGWEHLYLPAEFDGVRKYSSIGWTDPRTEIGELLDPIRLPKERLEQKRIDLGPRGYAGQFLQVPAPAAGAMVLRDWLRYWIPQNPGAENQGSMLPVMDYLISSWDCTFRKTSDSDYVAGQVWGVSGRDAYLLDQCHEKMNVPDMLAAIREMIRVWPGQMAIIIEEAAAGADVADTMQREIYGIELYKPGDRSKQERLHATLPRWEQGHVWLPHAMLCSSLERDYSWVQEKYVPELISFPGGMHDDQVDATSQALLWIAENGPGEMCVEVLDGTR